MKQTLIALLALLMLASCEQKAEETGNASKTSADNTIKEGEEPSYYSFTETRTAADTLIQRYHDTLVARANACNGPDDPKITFKDLAPKTSFMINANMLRDYLNDSTNVTMLNVYIAQKNTTDELKIIFIGAVDSVGTDGDTFYVEKAIHKASDNNNYVLDHTLPCPKCEERIAILGGKNKAQ
ncbi:MAG: hypothetical protein H6550_00860 [Chitinophagales bacterium]|nr:hypothetical protein [Chitinophagales bacterium]